LLAALGCLEPLEPTPDSSPVVITPEAAAVSVKALSNGWSFSLPLRVRNTGSRVVYVDLTYRHTEKLIDQKWEHATQSPELGDWRAIPPSQTQTLGYLVTYVRSNSAPPLLEHARGLYRVGLHLSYSSSGSDLFPPENSYSRSFVVVE
jgi:hypothetical protein